MKILHVIPSIAETRGGPSFVLRTLARSQAKLGMDVHVATTDDNGPGRLAVEAGSSYVRDQVTYRIFRRQTKFYTFSFPLTLWLWRHVSDYDVIHIHALFSYPSILAAWCAKLKGVPYIVRPLGVLNNWGMSHRRPKLKRLSLRWIDGRILRDAAAVQFTSEQESAEAAQLGVRHVPLLIPNPVDILPATEALGTFRAMHPILAGKTVILFLSRIDPKKGIDLLFDAFAALKANHSDVALVIAGDGDPIFVESLRMRAQELGMEDEILWVGFLEGENKRNAFADADIFVLSSYSENFGVAVVEAMGAGLPVIVSNQVGLHRDISMAGAGLVVECSVPQIESALATLVEDTDLRSKLATNALRLAQRFAPQEIALQLENAYSAIRKANVAAIAI